MSACSTNISWDPGPWYQNILSAWSITGADSSNTDNCKLYVIAVPFSNAQAYGSKATVWSPCEVVVLYRSAAYRDLAISSILSILRNFLVTPPNPDINAFITTGVVAAGMIRGSTNNINQKIILQPYNGSGISGEVTCVTIMPHSGLVDNIGVLTLASPPSPPIPPATTTTTTTYPGINTTTTLPPITTTTTTPKIVTPLNAVIATTTPTSTTTTTTPLLDAQVIQTLSQSTTEIVTIRRGALNYGTIAPGETSKTLIVSFYAPYVKMLNNISIGLIDTGGIEFSTDVFSISSSLSFDPTIIPTSSFIGVNTTSSSTSNYNIGVPNKDSHTSAYVYLNVKLPRNNFLGSGTIRYKWFFDFSD